MKYAPKKVFILKNGDYIEMSYEEFCRRKETEEEYMGKLLLPLHGMLMEVTPKQYKEFYADLRRQKYLDERSRNNGDFSYDMLTTDEFAGEDILVSDDEEIEEQVIRSMMLDKLRIAIKVLTEEERRLIFLHFYQGIPQTELSKIYGVNQSNISRKISRILQKIKRHMEA